MGSPTAKPARPRLDALTGVRFLAAAHVVLYHEFRASVTAWADRLTGHAAHAAAPARAAAAVVTHVAAGLANTGGASVGLFFVLSGFILAYCYLSPAGELTTSRRQFWVNRVARIYPTYLLGLVIIAPLVVRKTMAGAVAGPWQQPATWSQLWATLGLNLTLTQAWVPPVATTWNGPGWSLSVEALFYLSFPTLAAALLRGRGLARAWATAGGCLAVLVLLAAARTAVTSGLSAFTFLPVLRLPEFALGMAVGRIYALHCGRQLARDGSGPGRPDVPAGPPSLRWLAPLAAVATVVVLSWSRQTLTVQIRPVEDAVRGLLLPPLFAALIYGLAADDVGRPRGLARPLGWPPLVLLGEASYAVYILHVPVHDWMDLTPPGVWAAVTRLAHLPSEGAAFEISYILVTLAAAVAVFQLVETPARVGVRRLLDGLCDRLFATDRRPPQAPPGDLVACDGGAMSDPPRP